jgi:hypothetical protein
MAKASYRENIQQKMQNVYIELSKLQSSKHLLMGQKTWSVLDQKKESLEKELLLSLEEYQRILSYSFKSA